jgi:hypothetical protein
VYFGGCWYLDERHKKGHICPSCPSAPSQS